MENRLHLAWKKYGVFPPAAELSSGGCGSSSSPGHDTGTRRGKRLSGNAGECSPALFMPAGFIWQACFRGQADSLLEKRPGTV